MSYLIVIKVISKGYSPSWWGRDTVGVWSSWSHDTCIQEAETWMLISASFILFCLGPMGCCCHISGGSFSFRNSLLAVIESLFLSSWQSNYHKFVPCQLNNQTYSFCVMTFLPLWPLAHDQLMIKAFSPPLHSTRWSSLWLLSGHPSCCPRVELQVSL